MKLTERVLTTNVYLREHRPGQAAGNWTTRRSPEDRKETQTAVVWSCFPFIRSGQNHLARHSERGKKTMQTKEEVEDNIREWTGLEFGKSQRAVENREKWRKLVAKSSVVPQRPWRLREWWWWWWWQMQINYFHLSSEFNLLRAVAQLPAPANCTNGVTDAN